MTPPSRLETLDMRLSISQNAPQHDDEDWYALDPEIRDATFLQPTQIWGDLTAMCMALLQGMVNGIVIGSQDQYYRDSILAHGGAGAVTQELLSHVDPPIKALEGKEASRKNLDDIRSRQTDPWPTRVGYLDYITDSRLQQYVRLYVGQSGKSYARIIEQHIQAILRGKRDTLHYFILWMGNGNRTSNFIRLWSFVDQDPEDDWYDIKCDILELLFCIYMSSLPLLSIRKGASALDPPSAFGLNVMSPLHQHRRLSELEKLPFVRQKHHSPDPQIRLWASQRLSQRKGRGKTLARPPWSEDDYRNAILQATGEEVYRGIEKRLLQESVVAEDTELQPALQLCSHGENLEVTQPHGTLSARIGFVLDYAVTLGHSDVLANDGSSTDDPIPYVLRKSGFNHENAIIWTFNFRKHSTLLSPSLLAETDLAIVNPDIQRRHRSIIKASGARIFFLCGSSARKMILSSVRVDQRATLSLRSNYKYPIYVVHADGRTEDPRMCICCPELPAQDWSVNVEHACKLSEVLKFAVLVTRTRNVMPYFLESSTALGAILRQAQKEKMGLPKITFDTINRGLLAWLARKGFSDPKDIRELERRAGSLCQGLLMLLHVLPRCPVPRSEPPQVCNKRSKANQVKFDRAALQDVKDHYMTVTGRDREPLPEPDAKRAKLNHEQHGASDTRDGGTRATTSAAGCLDRSTEQSVQQSEPSRDSGEEDHKTEDATNKVLSDDEDGNDSEEEEEDEDHIGELLAGSIEGDSDRWGAVEALARAQRERLSLPDLAPEDLDYIDAKDEPSVESLREAILVGNSLRCLLEGQEATERDVSDEFEVPRTTKRTRMSRLRGGRKVNWWDEGASYKGKEYSRIVPSQLPGYVRSIGIGYCEITFPDDLDVGDGHVNISIDICALDTRHEHVFATSSTNQDPARHLAFKVTGTHSDGMPFTYIPRVNGMKCVFKANSFVEILLNRSSKHKLAETPRRYIHYRKGRAPKGLEAFANGGYTSPP